MNCSLRRRWLNIAREIASMARAVLGQGPASSEVECS